MAHTHEQLSDSELLWQSNDKLQSILERFLDKRYLNFSKFAIKFINSNNRLWHLWSKNLYFMEYRNTIYYYPLNYIILSRFVYLKYAMFNWTPPLGFDALEVIRWMIQGSLGNYIQPSQGTWHTKMATGLENSSRERSKQIITFCTTVHSSRLVHEK